MDLTFPTLRPEDARPAGEHDPRSAKQIMNPQHAEGTQRVHAAYQCEFDFIWRSARRLGLSPAEADDVTQQAFMVLSRRIHEVERGRERSFLFGTMTNLVADLRKRAAQRYEIAVDVIPDVPSTSLHADEALDQARARALLDEVVLALPLEFRTVFILFELDALSMAEIATLLEIAPGTVASRLRRARELFESALKRARARATFGGSHA